MARETLNKFAAVAADKIEFMRRAPLGFLISSMMAGAYVGLGIVLIFSIGADLDPGLRRLVMGASFGIALTLVVFAGSELFTGYTMTVPIGWLAKRVSGADLMTSWAFSWIGNLAGAGVVAALFVAGGGAGILNPAKPLLYDVAAFKMTSSAGALVARAILCNWLVCLALWMSGRMTDEAAKCIAIFWCLFAFIASGFEHSVANMTLLSIALLGQPPETVTWAGMAHNLFWVTIGNIIAGSLFMAGGYWLVARTPAKAPADVERGLVVERDTGS
jgi:nitrite transporter NirC